jgi:hypothetical protein
MQNNVNNAVQLVNDFINESKATMSVVDCSTKINYEGDTSVITLRVVLKNQEA